MSNIVNDKVEDYIRRTLKNNSGLLKELEDYALKNSVPIIQKEVSHMLKILLDMKKPKKILEIGCAIGYSSIFFCTVLNGDVDIITTERNDDMIVKAKSNIKKAGFEDKISILEGDAIERLKEIDDKFDFIFIDAAKGQYKLFYDSVIDKLKIGGLLVSDNILYKGMIAHDDFVIKRKKTIVKRMRSYLSFLCNCDCIDTSLVPIGDGVALSYKKKVEGCNGIL